MSAHCSTCGSDIAYPPGTWPLGTCEVCDLREQVRERDVLLADAKDALAEVFPEEDTVVVVSVERRREARALLARIEELEGKA